MDFKPITTAVNVDQIHRLFASRTIPSPIDPATDVVFGAYDEKRLVAATAAVPTRHNNKKALWVKFLFIDSEYRHQDAGFGLMQFQRSWALTKHYKAMIWAFNPLDANLAKLYFHDLGAVANAFHVSPESKPQYGLEVVWRLNDPYVKSLATQKRVLNPLNSVPLFFDVGNIGQPVAQEIAFDTEVSTAYRVEIPFSIMNLEQFSLAVIGEWNQALNGIFSQGFQKQYTITDFDIAEGRCWYVLTASTPWYLYVVECSDNTLYTGITPDLKRRLKLHNSGRGAAYTASRTPVQYVGTWKFLDRSAALRAEIAFKQLSRERKLRHISTELNFRGSQFLLPDAS